MDVWLDDRDGPHEAEVTTSPTHPPPCGPCRVWFKALCRFQCERGGEQAVRCPLLQINFREPKQGEPGTPPGLEELKYYSHEVHKAAFVLPKFAGKELGSFLTDS